jgi:hypothetical protein
MGDTVTLPGKVLQIKRSELMCDNDRIRVIQFFQEVCTYEYSDEF